MDRFIGNDGRFYDTKEAMKQGNKEFEELCAAKVTEDNIIKKSNVVERAAEEMSCDEYDGDEKMACDLARQLYNYFDGDMEKAEAFYAPYNDPADYGYVDAINWLKNLHED